MIEMILLLVLIIFGSVWWILKQKRDRTYVKILITHPFSSLRKGEVAIFKSGLEIEVGDYVLIRLPGYDMIWKVTQKESGKLWLINRDKEILTYFPKDHICGKLIGYEGFFDKKNNREN